MKSLAGTLPPKDFQSVRKPLECAHLSNIKQTVFSRFIANRSKRRWPGCNLTQRVACIFNSYENCGRVYLSNYDNKSGLSVTRLHYGVGQCECARPAGDPKAHPDRRYDPRRSHNADRNRIAEYDYDPISMTSTLLREYAGRQRQGRIKILCLSSR